jgi:hypothetical protein
MRGSGNSEIFVCLFYERFQNSEIFVRLFYERFQNSEIFVRLFYERFQNSEIFIRLFYERCRNSSRRKCEVTVSFCPSQALPNTDRQAGTYTLCCVIAR